jgi:CheY-like chemotaxis protein
MPGDAGGHRRYSKEDVIDYCDQKGIAFIAEEAVHNTILIVDDDEQFAQMLKTRIQTSGIDVVVDVAYCGFEAGIKVQLLKPQIILTDIAMPGLSGIEMCQMLKNDSATRCIRILGITGSSNKTELQQLLDAGAEVCLTKPVNKHELMQALALNSNS